ncbi:MAG: TonB-dependent receptor [Saprospiraceae bacterium]
MKNTIIITFVFLWNVQVFGQQMGSITGKVIERNLQSPIELANIQIDGTVKGASTDSLGLFLIENIPVGTYNLLVSYLGYKTYTLYNVVITSGNEKNYTIELEEEASTLSEVVVKGTNRTVKAASIETPLSVQRVTTEEIRSNPGGNFDISKVIQTLPGVGGGASGGSFRNDIIIRGGAPNENVFYLDGIEVPVINHFQTQGSSGGPQGMLNVSFIEDVKLSSSAFDARYDNAISSVFQFKQKNGNPNKVQGNIRLSASEVAATWEGPLSQKKQTTFLASARRSYLQLLFKALDLPIRPNYWDFQTKIQHQINKKTSLTFIGLGAIDEFSFAPTKKSTPENTYIINSSPLINQWNYTVGASLKRSLKNGFTDLALSRTEFHNSITKYRDNLHPGSDPIILNTSNETENKLRWNVNKAINGWKINFGASSQIAEYSNSSFIVIKDGIQDTNGTTIQPAIISNFSSPLHSLIKAGAYAQLGKRFAHERLGISGGIRTDINTFTEAGLDPFKTLSPRISFTYSISDKWVANASIGRYYKLAPYTVLGYADNQLNLLNKDADYLSSTHYVSGVEFIPSEDIRFTLEGFYKKYGNVPVSVRNGIALSNLGADFNVVGNEAVITSGKGKAYGFEFFAQKKLTERMFGILSYTYYHSLYSGKNDVYAPSSWDNRHLLSATFGYKFKNNWELGLKFRYQGGAPYTPFDEVQSRINYLSQGVGTLDYSELNTRRLKSFNSSDIRIDKKWNFKKTTLDFFIDVTNWYIAKNPSLPEYTFERTLDNSTFKTTDGLAILPDGKNAIPTKVKNDNPFFTPTLGFIWEF